MKAGVQGTILAAKSVYFDYNQKFHSIDRILNSIEVNTFPSILSIDVWGKLIFPDDMVITLWIVVKNPEGEIVLETDRNKVSNIREAKMTPGIDFSMSIRFLADIQGIYKIQLWADNKEISIYPLYIDCSE